MSFILFCDSRFEIQQELAFHEVGMWKMVMRYVSDVRLEDPDFAANLLLVNTYEMNRVIEESAVLQRGLTFASITCLTRFYQSKKDFVTLGEAIELMDIQIECVRALPSLDIAALEQAYTSFCQYLGEDRANILRRVWDSLAPTRSVVFKRAMSPEFKPHVARYLKVTSLQSLSYFPSYLKQLHIPHQNKIECNRCIRLFVILLCITHNS